MLYLAGLLLAIFGYFIKGAWLVFYLSIVLAFIPVAYLKHGSKKAWFFCMAILAVTLFRIVRKDLNIPAGVSVMSLEVSTLLASYAVKKYFNTQIDYIQTKLGRFIKLLTGLEEDKNYLKRLNADSENELLEIENLYEFTRVMSLTLEFKDNFSILYYVYQRIFKFKSCRLLLISDKDNESIECIYKINPPNSDILKDHQLKLRTLFSDMPKILHAIRDMDYSDYIDKSAWPLDTEVAKFILREKEPIMIRSSYDDTLGMSKLEKFDTLIATGLMIQNNIIGIIYMLDCNPNDFERFLIIAGQFGLELEKVKLYQRVQELAIVDSTTGVFVRRYLMDRLNEELLRADKHKTKFSFLMLDIDHFKECNDSFGHLVGDVVLKEVARLIKTNVREVDLVARFGGEEFCIGLPDTAKEEAIHVAERIRATVAQNIFRAYDETLKTSVSIGVATFGDDAGNIRDLIDAADKFMYCAKEKGRNRVCS